MSYVMKAFSDNDKLVHRKRIRTFWNFTGIMIAVIGCVGIYMLTAEKFHKHHWMVWTMLGVVSLVLALLYLGPFRRVYSDDREKLKVCGEFRVEKRETMLKGGPVHHLNIQFEGKVRELKITQGVFAAIDAHRPVYVEFSWHSATLFALRQGDRNFPC